MMFCEAPCQTSEPPSMRREGGEGREGGRGEGGGRERGGRLVTAGVPWQLVMCQTSQPVALSV